MGNEKKRGGKSLLIDIVDSRYNRIQTKADTVCPSQLWARTGTHRGVLVLRVANALLGHGGVWQPGPATALRHKPDADVAAGRFAMMERGQPPAEDN